MKRFFSVFAAVAILTMGMVSCGAKNRLERIAKEADEMCPYPVEGVGMIVEISYDGTDIVFTTEVDDNEIDIDMLNSNKKEAKELVLQEFISPDNDVQEMLDALRPANAGIKMIYVSKSKNKKTVIRLSVDEIEAVYNNPSARMSPEKNLQMQIDIANHDFPQVVGEGMVLTKAAIEGDYVVYLYEVDESIYDLDEMEAGREEIKSMLIDDEGDPDIIEFQSDCRKAKKGLSYRYVGTTTGKEVRFDIPASEL